MLLTHRKDSLTPDLNLINRLAISVIFRKLNSRNATPLSPIFMQKAAGDNEELQGAAS